MAINKDLKVNMCYSSKEAKNICECYLADEAKCYNKSLSAMREHHILNDILPTDPNANYWFQQLYNGSASVKDVMKHVFSYLAARADGKSIQADGTKLLVEYSFKEFLKIPGGIEQYKKEAPYFFNCLDSLQSKLIYESESIEDITVRFRIIETVRQLKRFIVEMKDNPDKFFYAKDFTTYVYMTILNFWDLLDDYTYTFRLLSCIAGIQRWDNTPIARIKLRKVLIDATANWVNSPH